MNKKNKSLMEIHLAVFLFGLSGLFGKLLSLPSIIIVLGRVFFSSIFLFDSNGYNFSDSLEYFF